MLLLLIFLLLFLRFILRNFGGDFTFALILITMFFVRLNIKYSTTNTIDNFSDIEKSCRLKQRRVNYTSDHNSISDYDYYNEQSKQYTALEFKVLELRRAKLEHEFYFQRLWTYSMLVLFFFLCAVCIPYATVYARNVYYQPEQVSRPEHKAMGFIAAVAVIAVIAHQV